VCRVVCVAPSRVVDSRAPHRVTQRMLQRCKEVVLKDFEFCYKHYGLAVRAMVGKEGYILACSRSDKLASVCTLLAFRVHHVCRTCVCVCVVSCVRLWRQ
jgi:hypothetical protein